MLCRSTLQSLWIGEETCKPTATCAKFKGGAKDKKRFWHTYYFGSLLCFFSSSWASIVQVSSFCTCSFFTWTSPWERHTNNLTLALKANCFAMPPQAIYPASTVSSAFLWPSPSAGSSAHADSAWELLSCPFFHRGQSQKCSLHPFTSSLSCFGKFLLPKKSKMCCQFQILLLQMMIRQSLDRRIKCKSEINEPTNFLRCFLVSFNETRDSDVK